MWSIRYNEERGEHVLTCNQEPRVTIVVPQMREADAMHLVIALEQAKAKPRVIERS